MQHERFVQLIKDVDRWNGLEESERAAYLGIGYWEYFMTAWNALSVEEQKSFKKHPDFGPLIVAYTYAYRNQTPENMDALMREFSKALVLLHGTQSKLRVQ